MSILINMEMPISCERCPMLDWDLDYIKCKVTDRHFKMTECWRSIRVPDCPLVPVPPHGRLIDADAAVANRNADMNWCYDLYDLPDYLSGCPTIIPPDPAEEGE